MHILDALARFHTQLQADGRSRHTCQQYQRHVCAFARWLDTRRHSGVVEAVGHEDVAQFLASPTARTRPDGRIKRATSLNALRTSIRVFFRYLHEGGFVSTNPGRLIRRAHCSPSPPRPLTDEEAERLMATLAHGRGPEAERDHALFSLLLASGIRIGTAIALDVQDLDLVAGELQVRTTKGDRPDRVFLNQTIRSHLRRFLGFRTSGPLFVGIHGRRITVRHAQRRFRAWAEQAGIRCGATCHRLRHTFAARIYEKTHDPFLVQKALRHRSIASTLVYAQAADERLRDALGA